MSRNNSPMKTKPTSRNNSPMRTNNSPMKTNNSPVKTNNSPMKTKPTSRNNSPMKTKSNSTALDDQQVPSGFEGYKKCYKVYLFPTRGNDSKFNTLTPKPTKGTTPCYWLGEYHSTTPSDVWAYPHSNNKKKDPSDFRGNAHGVYGYNNGMDDTLWFLPPKTTIPTSFTPKGIWTLPVQRRDVSSIEDDTAGFVNIGQATKVESYDVPGTWRLLYKKDGDNEPMEIHVRTPRGKVIDLFVEPTDTIDDVKRMVQDEEKIPTKDEIRLRFNDKPLDDKPTLEESGIQNGDVLDMEPMIICVKDTRNKTHTLTVDPADRVRDVKKQIERKEGTPVEQQRLFFGPKELKDGPTLRDSGIKHKDTLQLEPMQIHIKTPEGKTVTLNVKPDDTIQDVKKKMEQKEKIPVGCQRLVFRNKELDDPKSTLDDNNIKHGDTLNLEPMQIHVRLPNGTKKITLTKVKPTDTIRDIKRRVEDMEGTPSQDQRIFLGTKELDDGPTLKDYNIVHNDTLDLEGMYIFIKDWAGNKFKLDVEPTDTIDSVKEQIRVKEGHPKKNQFLIFKGTLLEDQPTLSDYGVKHKDVINLDRMKIYVRDWNGKTFPLDVNPTDSVDDVKHKIEDQEGHPKDKQKLYFDKVSMDDPYKTLDDHNVKYKDTLDLKKAEPKVQPPPAMKEAPMSPVVQKGPEYTVGMSPWSDPFASPAGYSPKKKIERDGIRAKGAGRLKDRYHVDYDTEMKELAIMAEERHKLKKQEQEYLKNRSQASTQQ